MNIKSNIFRVAATTTTTTTTKKKRDTKSMPHQTTARASCEGKYAKKKRNNYLHEVETLMENKKVSNAKSIFVPSRCFRVVTGAWTVGITGRRLGQESVTQRKKKAR